MSSGVKIRGLAKAFGDLVVLKDVDMDIARGESRVILGRSGQGKSVMLKLVVGLLQADAGTIHVDGEEVTSLDRRQLFRLRRRFSMVFQGGALFDSMTVGENVGLALREHTDLEEGEIQQRAAQALGTVGLPGVFDKLPGELSGGMRKRVGLARAVVARPDYILYDEPTTGLDPITSDSINRLIRKLDDELGVTSIVVTHDMASAFVVGDRFALLNEGVIVFDGSVDEAREAVRGQAIRQFIDGSAEGPLQAF